jgi:hypothetical protein
LRYRCDHTRRNPVKEPREDDERLSALLEGRVEGRQREELLAHLAEADDDYEVFTNTASVLRALEEEDARARRPVAVPPSMRRRGWPLARTLVAMAGTVVLLLAVGWLLRGRGGSAAGDPLQLAMNLNVDRANWNPWEPPGTVRGPEVPTAKRPRAVYAGAKLVDLAVAVRMRDTALIHESATALQRNLDVRTNPAAALSRIAAQPDASKDTLDAWIELATDKYAKLDREALEVGAWLEAARLAAMAKNAGFFANGASAGMLSRAKRLARGDAEAEKAVSAVHETLPRNGNTNWDLLAGRLETMLARLTQMGAPPASG